MTSHSLSRDSRLVLLLQRHRNSRTHLLCGGNEQLELPAGEIRQSDIVDLAGANCCVQELDRFLDRRQRVERMELVNVDRVSTEVAQRFVEQAMQPRPCQTCRILSLVCGKAAFRRQHHMFGDVTRSARESDYLWRTGAEEAAAA